MYSIYTDKIDMYDKGTSNNSGKDNYERLKKNFIMTDKKRNGLSEVKFFTVVRTDYSNEVVLNEDLKMYTNSTVKLNRLMDLVDTLVTLSANSFTSYFLKGKEDDSFSKFIMNTYFLCMGAFVVEDRLEVYSTIILKSEMLKDDNFNKELSIVKISDLKLSNENKREVILKNILIETSRR